MRFLTKIIFFLSGISAIGLMLWFGMTNIQQAFKTVEVISVVNLLKEQGEPEYLDSVTSSDEESNSISLGFSESGDDLYDKAVSIVCREKKASTSFIQRHLQIGYNRAARIIEKMESEGIVSPANHVGRREVLVGKDY